MPASVVRKLKYFGDACIQTLIRCNGFRIAGLDGGGVAGIIGGGGGGGGGAIGITGSGAKTNKEIFQDSRILTCVQPLQMNDKFA